MENPGFPKNTLKHVGIWSRGQQGNNDIVLRHSPVLRVRSSPANSFLDPSIVALLFSAGLPVGKGAGDLTKLQGRSA